MLYIDTSVLLPYTLTQAIEERRYRSTERFFEKIKDGELSAATSFYALHELYVFALDNAPSFAEGADFGKAALDPRLTDPNSPFCISRRTDATRSPVFSFARRDRRTARDCRIGV